MARSRVLGAEGLFVDGDGTPEKRLGFGAAARGPAEHGEVVDNRRGLNAPA